MQAFMGNLQAETDRAPLQQAMASCVRSLLKMLFFTRYEPYAKGVQKKLNLFSPLTLV
jgi:hypothetical protein